MAGGEKTLRHTAVHDTLYQWADRAGLQPEKERAGPLLPQRPEEVVNQHRCPAGIFLPSFNGVPAALDLAITAPQRQDIVALAGATSLAAATSYAATKASHLNTATLCAQQGIHFMPVVAESTEPEASKLLLQLSQLELGRMLLPSMQTSCKNCPLSSVATGRKQFSAGEQSLPTLPVTSSFFLPF